MPAAASDTRERLRERIREKKQDIKAYIARFEPRSNRLMMMSIIGTGLAALLTAGPAIGGTSFTQAVTAALGTTSPSWRLLCAAATIFSFLATTALSVHKMQDYSTKVSKAQSAHAQLESLEIFIDTTEIPVPTAADQYAQIVRDVPYLAA